MQYNDQNVAGTFAWTQPEATPNAGNHNAEWKFTPTDSNTYAEVTGVVTIKVTACVLRGGKEQRVGVEEVRKDDVFLVRPGESIPVDGVVLEGESAVNEAALTGESIPADTSLDSFFRSKHHTRMGSPTLGGAFTLRDHAHLLCN